jgi:RHH-type transcriptional regulator, rel operon repressor / antitoxin RelB
MRKRYIEYKYRFDKENVMPTSIRLPDDIERRLDFLARQTGRAKAFYIREMILEKIDDIEDYYLAASVLERVRKGKETTLNPGEMRKDLGLED